MSIQLSGFNSGLPVEDIISQLIAIERRPIDLLKERITKIEKEKSAVSNVQTRAKTLLDSVKALTSTGGVLSTSSNLFSTKKVSSSDEGIATASISSTAGAQSISLEVLNLATATRATSTAPIGQWIDAPTIMTDVAQGAVTEGDFTIFSNGTAYTFNVANTQTLGDVLTDIQTQIPEITGFSVTNGQINLAFTGGSNIQLGAASDTSNFLKATHLITGAKTATDITASSAVSAVNTNVDITTAAANLTTGVTAGTFEINGISFDTTGKSLSSIISEINGSAAKVTASFSPTTNTFQLIADDPGSSMILLNDNTSNFLTAMGVIVGGDKTIAQTAGENAQFRVNGTLMSSASNTVSAATTGLTGVTLNLTGEAVGDTITINVEKDTTAIVDGVKKVVEDINSLIAYIDQQTNAEQKGPLAGSNSFARFRQSIRSQMSDLVSGLTGSYTSLSLAGISTGAVTGAGATTPSSTFVFDEAKFLAALDAEPDNIRKLFQATTAVDGVDGIFTKMQSLLTNANAVSSTDGFDGIFAAYNTSAGNRIESLNDSIDRGEERLIKREDFLRKQFQVMESLIAQFQSQGNALSGLQSQLSANSGN
ncbi:MAG: flagellar filament capping protein FliD [Candidatus Melainabacteria bacterium]